MAATTDSAVTNGRARTSANSIVVAGDRTASRRTAHRHSKSVRTLKLALPIAALATARHLWRVNLHERRLRTGNS